MEEWQDTKGTKVFSVIVRHLTRYNKASSISNFILKFFFVESDETWAIGTQLISIETQFFGQGKLTTLKKYFCKYLIKILLLFKDYNDNKTAILD